MPDQAVLGNSALVLIEGDDPNLVFDQKKKLVGSLTDEASRALSVDEFDAATTNAAPVVDACMAIPFMTDRRIVVVRDVTRWTADDAAGLVSYLNAPNPTTTLILTATGGRMPPKLAAAIKASGETISAAVSIKDAPRWLADHVAAGTVTLDQEATKRIIEHIGGDTSRAVSILTLLQASYEPGAELTVKDIEPYLGAAGDIPPWDLTDAIEAGDTAKALDKLDRLIHAGDRHPLVVVGILHRWAAPIVKTAGPAIRSEADAASALEITGGRSTFPARKALNAARKVGPQTAADLLVLIADADLDLKGRSGIPAETVLMVLVARLSQKFRIARTRR